VDILRKSKKGAKNSYGSYLTEFVPELSIKFYISSPKTLKLVNISSGNEKGAKNSYGTYDGISFCGQKKTDPT
jgi:hypothetical protein